MIVGLLTLITMLATECAALDSPRPAIPLAGEAAEQFLLEAEVVELEEYDTKGITHPRRAVLTDGEITARAVFKDVQNLEQKWKNARGKVFFNLRDSYKHEIASYELDKLLGLGMVPPTVERKIGREDGSLQMWVEGSMTEWTRKKVEKLAPPDMEAWNNQVSTVKTYLQLIWDTDYNNISNVMVDAEFKIWKIGASRAFYASRELRREESLMRFSRSLLAELENLDRATLEKTLSPWLNRKQIESLWHRRDRILSLARERVAEFCEDLALYD